MKYSRDTNWNRIRDPPVSAVPRRSAPPRAPCIYTVRFFFISPEHRSCLEMYRRMLCATKLLCLLRRGDTIGPRRYLANQYSRFIINFENKQLNGKVSALPMCKSTDHPPRNWLTAPLDDDAVSTSVYRHSTEIICFRHQEINLNLPEPSGSVQTCTGITLPSTLLYILRIPVLPLCSQVF